MHKVRSGYPVDSDELSIKIGFEDEVLRIGGTGRYLEFAPSQRNLDRLTVITQFEIVRRRYRLTIPLYRQGKKD